MTLLEGGRYEFHVAPRLTQETLAAFPGFSVTDGPSGTVLLGHVRHDDELRDILSRMQQLRLRIRDVRRLPDRPDVEPADADAGTRTLPSADRRAPHGSGSTAAGSVVRAGQDSKPRRPPDPSSHGAPAGERIAAS